MALTNKLKTQVDIPVWEWCRLAPTASSAISATCTADNSLYHPSFGRYIYFMNSTPIAAVAAGYATGFFRYDTVTDTYQILNFPWIGLTTYTAMQFAGGQGYNAHVISAGTNTIQAACLTGKTLKGFDIRIMGGTGAGQQRIITDVADPVIAYAGTVTTLTTTPQSNLTDINANWVINQWVGYQVRFVHASGQTQTRKIMYNSSTVLTFSDVAKFAEDQWAWTPVFSLTGSPFVVSVVGTPYQIESSVLTVDTNWAIQPDETSRFMVRSGGIWMVTSSTTYAIQYYDVAADQWYVRNGTTTAGPVTAAGTEATIVNTGENATVFERGSATGTQTATTLQDTTKSWVPNQWAGYNVRFFSGTGEGKVPTILSNTANTLVFPEVVSLTPTVLASATGVSGSYVVTTTTTSPLNCNGWSITGTGIGASAMIVSGQGTTTLVLSAANTTTVSGNLTLGTSATGTISQTTITTSIPTPQTCNGWSITGTGIGTGATILAGQGTTNLVLSVVNAGAVSGIITMFLSVTAASGSAGAYTVTTSAVTPNFCNGYTISGTGIDTGATIVSGQGTTILTLSLPNTASVTGTLTLAFIPDASSKYFIDAFEVGIVSNVNPPMPITTTLLTATSGTSGTPNVSFTMSTPSNCNGWYISDTGITPGTTILSGQGTKNLILSANNIDTVSGTVIISPTALSYTAASGVINTYTITTTGNIPANANGWYISGTGIGVGATILAGQNTSTLTLSMINTATVSGTLYLYPTTQAPRIFSSMTTAGASGAATVTTSVVTPVNCNGWFATGTGVAVGAIVISGQGTTGLTLSINNSGTVSGNVITLSPTMTTATAASGVAGTYTITTSANTPAICNGWFISGTGIGLGATIDSGQGTTTLILTVANTTTVSGTLTISATAVSTASINGNVLTTGATTGSYYPGQILLGSGVSSSTTINTQATACFCPAASATIVFAAGTTAGIFPGMLVVVTGGSGTLTAGTYVSSVTNSTTLVLSVNVASAHIGSTLQFGPTVVVSAPGASSTGSLVTVTSTALIAPGMFVSIASGTGTITVGTYVLQVNSATTFTLSQAPTAALSAAFLAFLPYQTMITAQLSGTPGGAGTYQIYPSQGTGFTGSVPMIGFGNSVLMDTSKCWPINRWNNQVVRIKGGVANGDFRNILSTVPGYVTYTSGTTNANSTGGTLITLASGNTTGLMVGMVLNVTAGTGAFVFGTTVTTINSATSFTVSQTPTVTLSSATVTGSPVNTLVTYPAWNTTPDSTSRYVIHGDSDKNYISFGGHTPTFIHNIESDTLTMGRALEYGVARSISAQYGDYPPVSLASSPPSYVVLPITSAVGYVASAVVSAGSVTGGITTITHAGGTFPIGSWIIVASVVPTTYNGTWQVTNSSTGSVSYYNASGTYTSGGTVLQTNSITLGGNLASGAYAAFGNGTNLQIYGCVPAAYNGAGIPVAAGLAATPTYSCGGYQSAPGATNVTTTITVGDTTGLRAGMIPVVTAGTGAFTGGTVITSITNGTQFVVSLSPNVPLSAGAVVSVIPSVAWVGVVPGNLTTAGYVVKAPQAVTVGTRSGAACTLTTSLTIFPVGSWIHVSGITPGGYNGVFQVTASSSGSVTYNAAADPGGSATAFGTVGFATTMQMAITNTNHNFKTGQYITHKGDTGPSAVYNNITAQITAVPTVANLYVYSVAVPSAPMLFYAQSTTQLMDCTKNWLPNQWAGCMVSYNSTQFAVTPTQPLILSAYVISNTSNTLVFAAAHSAAPLLSVSRYVITAPASFAVQNVLGSSDSGLALGVQSATLLQDVTKAWVSPGGTVGILGTAIVTATPVVTVPYIANLYIGMQCVVLSSATVTLGSIGAITGIAPLTNIVTLGANFTGSGTAVVSFGYAVATATSAATTATLANTSGLFIGMSIAVSFGSVTLPAGTTITAISTSGLVITMSQAFAGTTGAAVLTFTAPCSSSGNTITVAGYSTTGLSVGMYVGVLSSGNLSVPVPTLGAFVANGGTNLTTVTVTSIVSATQFTVSAIPAIALSNATIIASFWKPGMWYNRRIKLTSGNAANYLEASCTGNNHNTLFVAITTPVHGTTGYTILQQPVRSSGTNLVWNFGASNLNTRGVYLYQARGGPSPAGLPGWDRLDLRTDKWDFLMPTPSFEGLTVGAMYAYDGIDRIYFTPQMTQRVYYLDIESMTIHGGSQYPYLPGTAAIVGNRMEIFETADGLKYLWLNRHSAMECFKQLLFY